MLSSLDFYFSPKEFLFPLGKMGVRMGVVFCCPCKLMLMHSIPHVRETGKMRELWCLARERGHCTQVFFIPCLSLHKLKPLKRHQVFISIHINHINPTPGCSRSLPHTRSLWKSSTWVANYYLRDTETRFNSCIGLMMCPPSPLHLVPFHESVGLPPQAQFLMSARIPSPDWTSLGLTLVYIFRVKF